MMTRPKMSKTSNSGTGVRFHFDDIPEELQLFQEFFLKWKITLREFRIEPDNLFQEIELIDTSGARVGDDIITW
jgi:hypothetical protein